jgi:hypothetical protein
MTDHALALGYPWFKWLQIPLIPYSQRDASWVGIFWISTINLLLNWFFQRLFDQRSYSTGTQYRSNFKCAFNKFKDPIQESSQDWPIVLFKTLLQFTSDAWPASFTCLASMPLTFMSFESILLWHPHWHPHWESSLEHYLDDGMDHVLRSYVVHHKPSYGMD